MNPLGLGRPGGIFPLREVSEVSTIAALEVFEYRIR